MKFKVFLFWGFFVSVPLVKDMNLKQNYVIYIVYRQGYVSTCSLTIASELEERSYYDQNVIKEKRLFVLFLESTVSSSLIELWAYA